MPAGYLATTGATILASQHNPPLEDIAAALTARLMRSGAAPMTGPLKLADGTVGAPSLAFSTAPTYGLYKSTSGIGVSINGVLVQEWLAATTALQTTLVLKDGGDTASANALTLGNGNVFNITGTTAITSIGTKGIGAVVWFRFDAALTFTHHATNLINLTGASITTRAGDMAQLEEYGVGTWRMVAYHRADGSAVGGRVFPIPALFKNLVIKVASNTTVTVAADFVTTTDATAYQTTAVSSTINLGTTGADALDTGTIASAAWYAIWVVAKADGTTKCVASLSSSAPTMPSGYTYKARVGWVRTASGSAQLLGTWQFGRRAQYIIGLAQCTDLPVMTAGSTNGAWTAASVTSVVPTTASVIHVNFSKAGGTGAGFMAPNNSYGVAGAGAPFPPITTMGANSVSGSGSLLLESTNIYSTVSSGGGTMTPYASGWEDNI